ncbi:MAG: hypothetical protein HY286_07135 [Planctomycetes bacterium]|nr:hypothetical protein [Planctomycetota bacterium]
MRILRKLAIGLFVALVVLAIAEIVVRGLLPREAFSSSSPIYEIDDAVGFRVAPNLHFDGFTTNSFGARSGEPDAAAAERILVCGDSITLGAEVKDNETFCSLLQQNAGSKLQIVNAGCPGYGPIEESAAIERLAPIVRPTRIWICFFCGNDYLDAGQPDHTYLVIGGRLVARQRYYETSAAARFFKEIGARAWSFGLLRAARMLAGARGAAAEFRSDDGPCGMDSTAIRVLLESEDYNNIDPAKEPFVSRGWRRIPAEFTKIREQAARFGARLDVIVIPLPIVYDPALRARLAKLWKVAPDSIDAARPERMLNAALEKLNIPVFDAGPALAALAPAAQLHEPSDLHFSKAGHRAFARILADRLK